jgi:mannose-1-phosphate guanylyltransferase
MNFDHCYAVIMAGGGGTRLWPLSRQAHPKQMIHFFKEGTLFQLAVRRLLSLFGNDKIYIVTIAEQANELKRDCPEIPSENFLIEPQPRGTASVIGLSAIALKELDPQAIMAVLTSDHFIKNDDVFQELVRASVEVASADYLVTLGVIPTYPATGYGYIQRGDLIGEYLNMPVYIARRFKEKPDKAQAEAFIESHDHDWNSGMFVWRVDRILGEFKRQMPEFMDSLMQIEENWNSMNRDVVIQKVWPKIKPQTIDYGIMENADRMVVIPATGLGWSDVGSWESLFEVLPVDEKGNINLGSQSINLETTNSLVYSTGSSRLVVTIGLNNLIIVDTGDALLVCERSQAQLVRQLVSLLRQNDRTEYL